MKQLTSGDYQLFIETAPSIPRSDTMVRIWSKWNGAKNPNELQRKFEYIFSIEEIDRLIDILAQARDTAVVCTEAHQPVVE